MKRIILILFVTAGTTMVAQPPARRTTPQTITPTESITKSTPGRDFPVQEDMPGDVVWRRDIYRSLDLSRDANATLYYPTEPQGERMNLFTYLFHLILRQQINAYDYRLDGNERFTDAARVKPQDIMDRYQIFYESKDGRVRVQDADLPAAEVLTYYVKESAYFNQQTSTFHRKIVALCPVMKRSDEWGGADISYPMFWINYDEAAPHLSKLPLMGSNYNNAFEMTAADFFALNRYEGKIYKTNNLQGKILANYCPTDSALAKEQRRIEQELIAFEQHVWGKDSVSLAVRDSLTLVNGASNNKSATRAASASRQTKVDTPKPASSTPSAPRVSVRRQRK